MIRCVLFDVGGVLLTLGEREYRSRVAQRLGLSDVPETYEDLVPRIQRGEVAEVDVWFELSGVRVDPNVFDDIFRETFPVTMEMTTFAAELRDLGLRTAVLSNTQNSHGRIMRTMGFLDEFHPVFFSHEVGARKPEPEVFRRVLAGLDLPPEAVIFIDDVAEYVEAAAEQGIHALQHTGDARSTRARVLSLVESQSDSRLS